jgi:FkbM family methyltransferase
MGTSLGCPTLTTPVASPVTLSAARTLLEDIVARANHYSFPDVRTPLFLYGAGNLGRMAKTYLDHVGVSVAGVVDARPAAARASPFWEGVEVMSPDEVPRETRRSALLAICVATAPWRTVTTPLRESGWSDPVPFYDLCEGFRDQHPLSNGWHSGPLSSNDAFHIARVLDRWHDDVSRAHHVGFAAWRALREEWPYESDSIDIGNRFFIPEVMGVLHDQEVFLDVGAHEGEVAVEFARRRNYRFAGIHVIEPDAINCERLIATVDAERTAHPEVPWSVHRCATHCESGPLPFMSGLGYPSQISIIGNETVEGLTLTDLDIPASFVKLHLEGWELDTLLGGTAWLTATRPIVAATVYHNRDGLWRLPYAMMALLSDYRFYFRAHSWLGTGCVVYAIPEERFANGVGHPVEKGENVAA